MRIIKWYGDNPIDGFLMVPSAVGEGIVTVSHTAPSGKGRGSRARITRSYDIVAVGKSETTISLTRPTARKLLESVTPTGSQISDVECTGALVDYT